MARTRRLFKLQRGAMVGPLRTATINQTYAMTWEATTGALLLTNEQAILRIATP